MALPEIKDVDKVLAAIEKAREHAQTLGKPIQLDRVAVFLGVSHNEIDDMMDYNGDDEERRKMARALKNVKQESRADLEDCLADKGNVTGYMFLGKVNHGMVETTRNEVEFKGVIFEDESKIPD